MVCQVSCRSEALGQPYITAGSGGSSGGTVDASVNSGG